MDTLLNKSLNCAVLTISDTRTQSNDTSGDYLRTQLGHSGHQCVACDIVKDDVYQIRKVLSDWIFDAHIQVVITTGGTGFTLRDSTPEAVRPLLDKEIVGFGELFRMISYQEGIGSSTIQSRALAGMANKTLIFCLPGSNHACQTAWEKIIKEQINSEHEPCNFVAKLC